MCYSGTHNNIRTFSVLLLLKFSIVYVFDLKMKSFPRKIIVLDVKAHADYL